MKAILKQPGKFAEVIEIENTLEALQNAVEGYIEVIRVSGLPGLLIVNEEGKIREMPPNLTIWPRGDTLVGPILYVGEDGDEFTDAPTSLAQFCAWMALNTRKVWYRND